MNRESAPSAFDRYSVALTLMQYHINVLWVVFGVFLLVEAMLLGSLAQMYKELPSGLFVAGSAVGVALVIPWWATFEYTRWFYLLRIQQAQECEPKNAPFLAQGEQLSRGATVGNMKIPWPVRALRPQRAGWSLMVAPLESCS